jgi:penicillin amidase
LPKDRAKRIDGLLQPKNNWTFTDVQKMILDNTSSVTPSIVSNWTTTIDEKAINSNEKIALEILKKWKGTNAKTEIAPTIYTKWLFCYLKNTFQDELGKDDFNALLGTHIIKKTIANQSQNEASPWWDNLDTKNKKETRQEILSQSFKEAISALEKQLGNDLSAWTWNKVHTLEHQHPLGKVAALRGYFNVGPFEVDGTNEVINNLLFYLSEDGVYKVTGGPSTRRIIDFSDVENSVSVLPTGQSGVPTSPHYDDQAEMYAQGKFRKMKMNEKEIRATSTKLVFVPKK